MPNYRLPELSLSTRIELALEMIKPIPEREWGWATKMAEKPGVSRKFLYDLRAQGLDALAEGLSPQKTGPKAETSSLEINKGFIQRSIAILPLLKGSVRDIQHGLGLLFGVGNPHPDGQLRFSPFCLVEVESFQSEEANQESGKKASDQPDKHVDPGRNRWHIQRQATNPLRGRWGLFCFYGQAMLS